MTPRQAGNYRLDRLLGPGGMGQVYEAYDTYRDRYVALKLLPEGSADDQEYLKRFLSESQVAAQLREPHVIPIHDYGEINGQIFIDMRLVDGTDMGALLDGCGRIDPERAVHLISQVAQALDAAHADGLVHRDVKPSSILVTSNDFVYVVDFGIARSVGGLPTGLSVTGATTGTLHYMAPERFAGRDVDGRADVYSLACVLHECLAGAPPFTGEDLSALMYAHLYSSPRPASSLVEGVPPALDAVIARGMAKDPDDRFATAGALAAAASAALLTEAPAPPPMREAPITEAPITEAPITEPPITEPPITEPPITEPPVTQTITELRAPAWTETPAPAWRPAPVLIEWQDVAEPPGQEAEPGRRDAGQAPDSPTQTVIAADDGGGIHSPRHVPQVASPEPDGGRRPAGEAAGRPGRGPSWRRLGVLLLIVAAAVAVPIVIVLMASAKPATSASAKPGPSGSGTTSTGAAAPSGSATAAGQPAATLPTVAAELPAGQNPSYVEVAPNGRFAYVADPGAGVITVLNTATDRVAGTIKIPQGPPQFVSFSPDSRTAYVSVYNPGKAAVHLIAFIDTATRTVTATVQVDNFTPGPSTPSPDGRFLYVPNHNTALTGIHENVVDVIDTATRELTGHIAVPANPHWVVFGKNGRLLYTTDHMSAKVTVVNAATDRIVTSIVVGETPHSEDLSPNGRRLAVTSFAGNEVFVINTVTDRLIATIPVGRNPVDIAYSPDGKYLFTVNNEDNSVTVIDAADNRVVGTVTTGKAPTSISMLPNGRQAYVTDENDGTIEILNLEHGAGTITH
jgi:YVTN family beta-propeller protein